MTRSRIRLRARLLGVASLLGAVAVLTLGGPAAGSSGKALVTITVDTLPIANALPLDLGIKKGFFSAQGIEINKRTLQSGNDVVLALANNNGDIGYLGWVPMMIAATQGIPFQAVAASEVEGTSNDDNWQNIVVKGDSSIRTPQDLANKTIAVNALKGVGEVMIRAAFQKLGIAQSSVKLLALPFPSMRAALRNGQVDAIWVPEPFLSQALNLDGARVVMAPGPILGKFWPIGGYAALSSWTKSNPALAKKFRIAINQSLSYAQSHPDEIRALLPAGTQNVRLPIWSPVIDRAKLRKLAQYAKDFGVISKLPNLTQLVPLSITGGKTLQGIVNKKTVKLLLDGKGVKSLPEGEYTFVVSDTSKTAAFRLRGPGVNRNTPLKGTGRSTWTLALRAGKYTYSSVGKPKLKKTFKVV
ncbi:MAG TPA: ABC transporter substrate-binding protein [Gaiellaceae bacterium]